MPLPQTIAITGASGLVGSALADSLRQAGCRVRPMVRRDVKPDSDEIYWNVKRGEIDHDALAGCDAVVHLAGESIVGLWSESKKQAIVESRVEGTRLVAQALADIDSRPGVLVSASAIGFYGNRPQHPVDENSPPGEGFLAETCVAWEQANRPAWEAGVRVVQTRLGLVLSRDGGVLATMRTPFKLGLGGVLGDGRQVMSWVTLKDLTNIFHHCLANDAVNGAVNAVSPNPVTNREFTKTLGRVLGRPTVMPAPKSAVRMLAGEMADEMLLASANVRPTRLEESGFGWVHPELEPALREELGRRGD